MSYPDVFPGGGSSEPPFGLGEIPGIPSQTTDILRDEFMHLLVMNRSRLEDFNPASTGEIVDIFLATRRPDVESDYSEVAAKFCRGMLTALGVAYQAPTDEDRTGWFELEDGGIAHVQWVLRPGQTPVAARIRLDDNYNLEGVELLGDEAAEEYAEDLGFLEVWSDTGIDHDTGEQSLVSLLRAEGRSDTEIAAGLVALRGVPTVPPKPVYLHSADLVARREALVKAAVPVVKWLDWLGGRDLDGSSKAYQEVIARMLTTHHRFGHTEAIANVLAHEQLLLVKGIEGRIGDRYTALNRIAGAFALAGLGTVVGDFMAFMPEDSHRNPVAAFLLVILGVVLVGTGIGVYDEARPLRSVRLKVAETGSLSLDERLDKIFWALDGALNPLAEDQIDPDESPE